MIREDEDEGGTIPDEGDEPLADVPADGWLSAGASRAPFAGKEQAGPSDGFAPDAPGRGLRQRIQGLRERLAGGLSRFYDRAGALGEYFRHPTATAQVSHAGASSLRLDSATMAERLDSLIAPDEARRRVEAIMGILPPKGSPALPENVVAAAILLADEVPVEDFQAVDLLHQCYPRGTRNSDSRVLMAIGRNLCRNFGLSSRRPIAGAKAWTMIDTGLFSDELAAQLAHICRFVLNWQETQSTFLILEFAEIELIEYLFEALHPRRHAALLLKVMEFKVLSARRVGLIRRIPSRCRRFAQDGAGQTPERARTYVQDWITLLERLSQPDNFAAVIMAARVALEEMRKMAEQMAAPPPSLPAPSAPGSAPAQPPTPGGEPLHPVMRGLGNPAAQPPLPLASAQRTSRSLSMVSADSSPPRLVTLPSLRQGAAPSKRRYTKKQKTEAVMRLIQGEDRDWVALSMGIRPDTLSRWHDDFVNGGSVALGRAGKAGRGTSRKPEVDGALSLDALKGQLQSLLSTVEQLSSKIAETEAPPPPITPEPPPATGGRKARGRR